MHRIGRFVMLTSALACATGGSSTRLSDSWRDPGTTQLAFNRTLAVYMSPDQGARQAVEDKLASRIPNGVPAYRALPNLSRTDPAQARQQLQGQGFDGVVAMRVVGVEQSGEYVPGSDWYASRRGFDSFWGPAWVVVEDPGYRVADRVVTVETRIFSIPQNRLVWAGRTQTENPKSVDKLVESTADAVGSTLREQGLIR